MSIAQETQGVCVTAYKTDEFPAFFTGRSSCKVWMRSEGFYFYYKNTIVNIHLHKSVMYICVVTASPLSEFDFPAEILPVVPFEFSYVCLKLVKRFYSNEEKIVSN